MNRHPTTLFDRASDQPVEASLLEDVTEDIIRETERQWRPILLEAALRVAQAGGSVPEHWHWDWSRKVKKLSLLAYKCFGVELGGEVQGLMMVNTAAWHARLDPDRTKPLVYVDYLESAPWNLRDVVASPRFGAVGTRLVEAAVRCSLAERFAGRVALHALPQSEDFYERVCHMTRVASDPSMQGLFYFELTAANAQRFLGGEP